MLSHLLHERVNSRLFLQQHLGAVGLLRCRVLIGHCKASSPCKALLQQHEDVYGLVLHDARHLRRVRDHCLHRRLVELKVEFGNCRAQCCLQQLHDLPSDVLVIGDEDCPSSSLLSTSLEQRLRGALSDSDAVYSAEFAVL